MDSFEKKIEEYRRELLKYAEKHGNIYEVKDKSFTESMQKKIYNEAYISNRPMPDEYDGNEAIDKSPTNFNPEADTDNIRNSGNLYNSYEDFIADNPKQGKLRVQAYASKQVFPIQNAKVTVIKEFGNSNHVFAEAYTNIDGIAENIILPTKDKMLSLSAGGEIPYSTYKVIVSHPKFVTQIYENVPIFDSIESMQPVIMLPLSNIGSSQTVTEDEPRF